MSVVQPQHSDSALPMTYLTIDGHAIMAVVEVLDRRARESGYSVEEYENYLVLKVVEEVGEVAQAVIGRAGHNPRKGTTHSTNDLILELGDVALSALVAMAVLAPEWAEIMDTLVRSKCGRLVRKGTNAPL